MSTDTADKTASKTTEKPAPPAEEPLTSGFKPVTVEEAATTYQIVVYTGNVPYAGTDGDVWVWFDGTYGRSGWLYLDNPEDNFEQNKTDYFYATLQDLGQLTAAWIYFRPLGGNSAWYLNTVTINGRTFSCYRWLVSEGMVTLNPT